MRVFVCVADEVNEFHRHPSQHTSAAAGETEVREVSLRGAEWQQQGPHSVRILRHTHVEQWLIVIISCKYT